MNSPLPYSSGCSDGAIGGAPPPPWPARRLPHIVICLTTMAITWTGCRREAASTPPQSSPAAAPSPGAAAPDAGDDPTRDGASPGGSQADVEQARFLDRAAQAGLQFTYRNGEEAGVLAILESLGGGAGLFDFDGEGLLDVFLPGGGEFLPGEVIAGRPSELFRNRGGLHFTRCGQAADSAKAPHFSHGASAADFDDDGFVDLLVTGYGGLLLFHNNGDGTFHEVARARGLDDNLWSSSAGWGDFNNDGRLDLYVAHYVNWSLANNPPCPGPVRGQRDICSPRQFEPLPDSLFLSEGNGLFREASAEMELRTDGKGLGVVVADIDADGDADIYVGNDTVPNFLYRNDGAGPLVDWSRSSGASVGERGVPDGSMGVDVGDYNGDGLPDIWVANYERESFALYRNEGACLFQHISQSTGVAAIGGLYVGWGSAFFDFDGDGDEDVLTSNGHVIRFPSFAPLRQRPLLFQNQNGKRFTLAENLGPYFDAEHHGRGLALGDLDNDGDQDVVVVHTNEPAALLEHRPPETHDWLHVQLVGTSSARDPVGAFAILELDSGERLLRLVKSGGSYASTSDRRMSFGLGTPGSRRPKSLEVHWPGGAVETFAAPDLNTTLIIVQGTGRPWPTPR